MPKILNDPSSRAKKKKYGHDISRVLKFSSSVGHLLPVYYDLSLPGDKYRLNTEMFTQVTDIVSPAMMHVTEHIDWFFVPLQHISTIAGNVLYGISDIGSSLIANTISNKNNNVIPLVNAANSRFENARTYFDYDPGDPQSPAKTLLDLHQNSYPTYDLRHTDVFDVPNWFNAKRLAQLLGFSSYLFDESLSFQSNILLNPMLLCAYHKIFYDHYRITDRTPNDPSLYNLDQFLATGSTGTGEINDKLFTIHYRPYERDFFQITKVAPMIDYGSVGMLDPLTTGDTISHFNNWLYGGQPVNEQLKSLSFHSDTATLRGSFAVEKLMELTRRAAKHYDSQTLAHFGFKVPTGISGEVYRVGNEKCVLQVNEVIAQSAGSATVGGNTVTSTLGQRGGRSAGYAPAKRNIEFTAPCHGILMAVYSAIPKADYLPTGLDRINTYAKRYDYFFPTLDNLGMQPLFKYQFIFSNVPTNNSAVYGYHYRYQEMKLKYNLCCGAFTTVYKYWTVYRDFNDLIAMNYYCGPDALDNVLLVHFHNALGDEITDETCFARDPLLHWFKFNVFKSSELSTYSLPNL